MKSDNTRPVRIPAAQAERLISWQLPVMDVPVTGEPFNTSSEATIVVTDEEIEPEALSLADIEAIRENALKEGFQQGHQDGFEQGYAEGKQQGYEQAFKQAESEVQRRLQLLEQLAQQLRNPIAAQEQQLESMLLNLVKQMSRAVIHAELQQHPEPLLGAIKAALAELPSATLPCELHLHPEDLAIVEQLAQPLTHHKGIKWLSDESMARGGCVIVGEHTRVDNQLETRFEQILAQLDAHLDTTSPQPAIDR